MKSVFIGEIIKTECLSPGVFSTWISCPGADFGNIAPGQFVGVYPNDPSALLPRPISLCEFRREEKQIRLVYRTVGRGTKELSASVPGQSWRFIGFLGNGYDINALKGKDVTLFGGGIGIPPMLGLAQELKAAGQTVTAALGYRGAGEMFLREEFEKVCGRVIISTDDGSAGIRGTVIDAVQGDAVAAGIRGTVIDAVQGGTVIDAAQGDAGVPAVSGGGKVFCACGPMPMLKGIKAYAEETGAKAFISLEERMACGVGVCLGCVCRTTSKDAHSNVNNARICTEGPVFDAAEVEI